jgi:hypothetical protein
MIPYGMALEALGIKDWVLRDEPTNEAEFLEHFRRIDVNGQEVSDPAQFGITWAELEAKRTEMLNAEPLKRLRAVRNTKLAETDWTQNKDIPDSVSDVWTAYRQALRDITNTYTSLDDVVWPEKPE